jgi:hypothetical protein
MLYPKSLVFLLLACGQSDPVDEDAAAPDTAQAVQQAAVPAVTGGLAWTFSARDRVALFGPPGSPAFSIQCQKPREGERQLIFIRYLAPNSGGNATLSFTGNGQAASLSVSAVTHPSGIGGEWRAVTPPDEHARDVAEAFAGPGTVEVSVSGTSPLVVPSTDEPRRVLADCLGP